MAETCRFCDREGNWSSNVAEYVQDVKLFAQIKLALHDYLPSKLCDHCTRRITDAVSLRALVKRSEELLLSNYLIEEAPSPVPQEVIARKHILPSGKPIKTEVVDWNDEEEAEEWTEQGVEVDTMSMHVEAKATIKEEISPLPVVVSYEEVQIPSNVIYEGKVEEIVGVDIEDLEYMGYEVLEEGQIEAIDTTEEFVASHLNAIADAQNQKRRKRQPRAPGQMSISRRLDLPPTGPYHCEPCNKIYEKKTSFLSHYRDVHDPNPRRFVCDICGVAYTRDVSLKGHMNVHLQLKPFKCDICGAAFARKYAVSNHMRSHTKLKKFFCKYCNKGFSFLTDVKRHETVHTGIYLYYCGYCKKGFNRKKNLHEHEMEHVVKLE